MIQDRLSRPLRDLRISVTDRCNFRCPYCMPREAFGAEFPFLPRTEILAFEEIQRLVRIFFDLGVRKVRLTGGEPLLRADLPVLVRMISELEGPEVALTTNGSLLIHQAEALAEAGLSRITVSLDSLDDATFRRMNDVEMPVERVLAGIEAAISAGLGPVKVNAVIRRGVNDNQIVDFARYFKGKDAIPRFIEYMDVGTTNGWRLDEVVSGSEMVSRIATVESIEPVQSSYRGEVARRWRFRDGSGEFGVITSVSRPFCGDCTRMRLSADGKLYTCLFATAGHDLRGVLRQGAEDEEIEQQIASIWGARFDRYSESRSADSKVLERVEMSYIGG